MAVLLRDIVKTMLEHVPITIREELLRAPEAFIQNHFAPVRIFPLTNLVHTTDECSCDGYYEGAGDLFPTPWILYRRDVSRARIIFTLLHELGHHIIRHVAVGLLDMIDQLAGTKGDLQAIEERACHEFAGQLLVADSVLDSVLMGQPVSPIHLQSLHEKTEASWDAAAVRLASRIPGTGAIILVRDSGEVSFCASSPGLSMGWPRGSKVAPRGPLARALKQKAIAAQDVFRWQMGGADRLWVDVLPVHAQLSVAVMADRPSVKQLNIVEPVAPKWKTQLLFCAKCEGARNRGWCDICKGRRCEVCDACGCFQRAAGRVCPSCHLEKGSAAYDPGSDRCKDCR